MALAPVLLGTYPVRGQVGVLISGGNVSWDVVCRFCLLIEDRDFEFVIGFGRMAIHIPRCEDATEKAKQMPLATRRPCVRERCQNRAAVN